MYADDDSLTPSLHSGAKVARARRHFGLHKDSHILSPQGSETEVAPLKLSTRMEYSSIVQGQAQDVFGLITIEALDVAPVFSQADVHEQRQAMDVVCLLDTSGSMQGEPILQVKDAVSFIVSQADPRDRLSIVTFSDRAERKMRFRRMDQAGKESANEAMRTLNVGGGTRIAQGLKVAFQVLGQRRKKNVVTAILLLTDGQDYRLRGQRFLELKDALAGTRRSGCSLYPFGFGPQHDAALLGQIAEVAQTPFTYVASASNIREAFAGTVGGLSSVVAKDVEVRIETEAILKAVHTPFSICRPSTTVTTISIPDVFAGERRDILLEFTLPEHVDNMQCLASAKYMDLVSSCPARTQVVPMAAKLVEERLPEEPDAEVSAHRERVEVTRALEEAARQSDLGLFESAQSVLDAALRMMDRQQGKTEVSVALLQEIRNARGRMLNKSVWESGGRAEVKDAYQMHRMQRCTMSKSSHNRSSKDSKHMYVSKKQVEWIALSTPKKVLTAL